MILIEIVFNHHSRFNFIFCGIWVILLYNGGRFGVIPSLIRERYGSRLMVGIYGTTLLGWGVGGMIRLQIKAYIKDNFPGNAGHNAFYVALEILILGLVLSVIISLKKALN